MISRGHRGTATGRPHTRTACIAPKGGGAEWGETQKRQSWNAAIERRMELKEVVGTQTPGLGPYTTDRDIPTLGAGGETAGIWA